MDLLSTYLDGPRARGAFLLRCVFTPPFALRIEDQAPLAVVAVTRGHATLVHPETGPRTLSAGDVAVLRGPTPYTVADTADTPPRIVVQPGNACQTLWGEPVHESMGLGLRTWGTDLDGDTMFLTGVYAHVGAIATLLLDDLPAALVVPTGDDANPIADLLAVEMFRESPGQQAVLDRLLDVALIHTIRRWFDRHDREAPAWYVGLGDPVVGPALQALHVRPHDDWTVNSLADEVGMSRAGLARRFTDVVGTPPMRYLRDWRMALAADLLADPDRSVTSVAAQVGYNSPFTFSSAFKRHHGTSPSTYRTGA